MERVSRYVYGPEGSEVSLTLSVSVKPWTPMDRTIGGMRIATSGVPASYVARRDSLLQVTLRFYETEWLGVLNLLAFGQSAASFLWYPEAGESDVVEVYLDSPAAGETITPTRDAEFPRVMELAVMLRGAGTAVPWSPYFRLA